MKNPFRFMSKGSWIIVGVIVLTGLLVSGHTHRFLKGNVWKEGRIEDASPRELELDMEGLHVAHFVSRSARAALGALLIAFIYLAVRLRRQDDRIRQLRERALSQEREHDGGAAGPSAP